MARTKPRFARDATVGSLYGVVKFSAAVPWTAVSTTGGARVQPPEYETLLIQNLGESTVYLKMGGSTVTASATDFQVALRAGASTTWRFADTADTHIAAWAANACAMSVSGCE